VTERLSRELRIFHELARVVAVTPYDADAILRAICSEFRTAFSFERALLVRFNERERTVHAVVQQGVEWPGDQWLMLDKFPFLVAALEGGRAVLVTDARAEAAMPSTIIERFGVRSLVAVPLLVRERCLGFMVGDRTGGELSLGDDELSLLTALGAVAAVLIEKADQYTELQRSLEERDRLDRAKDDFISIASHELRTPIAVVDGIATTLQLRGQELRAGQLAELREALVQETARLRSLAEQLLDLSQLDAGVVLLRPERFHARDRCRSLLQRIAPDRAADVAVSIPADLELDTDPVAFERVLWNLVENALQYGEPPVELRAETADRLSLVVEDRGIGVDPEFVPQLFERFTRSDVSRDHRPRGAGLGLAIAASFARALGGELIYEPAEPRGARFTFVLPPV
jgi:signal transduction histidine kinase